VDGNKTKNGGENNDKLDRRAQYQRRENNNIAFSYLRQGYFPFLAMPLLDF